MLTSIVEVWRLDKGDKFYHGGNKTPYEVVENLGDGFIKYLWRGKFGSLSDGWKVNAIVDDLSKINKWALKQKPLKKTQDTQQALNEFQEQSRQTAADLSQLDAISIHGLGTWSEGGEVGDIYKKFVGHGHPLDLGELNKEAGDCLWYASRVCDFLQVRLGVVWGDAKALEIDKIKIHGESQFSITDHAILDCLAAMANGSSKIFWHARELNRHITFGRIKTGDNDILTIGVKEKILNGLVVLVAGLKSLLCVHHVDVLKVLEINQLKLKERYNGGFSAEASMERVDTKTQSNNQLKKLVVKFLNICIDKDYPLGEIVYFEQLKKMLNLELVERYPGKDVNMYELREKNADISTCPECHKPITNGEEFVFKKCFECASGKNKEAAAAVDIEIFNKIIELALNSHMTPKEYQTLYELINSEGRIAKKCNCGSSHDLYYVDNEWQCRRCLEEFEAAYNE